MKIIFKIVLYFLILSILLINGIYAKPSLPESKIEEKLNEIIVAQNENENTIDNILKNNNNFLENINYDHIPKNQIKAKVISETEVNIKKNYIDNSNYNHNNSTEDHNNSSKVSNLNTNTTLSNNETENKISNDDNDNEVYFNRVKYAKKMITFMNQSIDPCDDFYEYACGNWKNTIIPRQSEHKRSNLLDINFELADMVENLLNEPVESLRQKYADELKQAKIFYQSCLEADLYPLPKSDLYLEVIKSIGGFPAVDETWNPNNFSWFNTSAYLSNYGGGGFTNEDIGGFFPFPPYFKLPELGFDLIVHSDNIKTNTSHGYILNEKRMREYLTKYGVKNSKVNEIIESVFELWLEVLKIMDLFDEDLDKCRKWGRFVDMYEWTPWNMYFDIAWQGTDFDDSISDCPCPYLYAKIDEICNERKEATANYLAMKFLYIMDARLDDKKFQHEFCNQKVKNSLQFLLDKLFIEQHFHPEMLTEVTEITKEIQSALRKTLEKLDWLDEETRTEALKKETSIKTRIGIFENEELKDRLIREMRNLTFELTNYEKNNIEISKFKQYSKRYIGFHYTKSSNETMPLELLINMQANAFYYNIDNSINVMAGILHPPAYHRSWPYSLKYGTLGYLIGHEFTHGFDTMGAFFDENGKFGHWWSKKSERIFKERTNCYVSKFEEYLIPEIKRNINGKLTVDENIADNGGLRNALSAYHNYIKKLNNEEDENKMSILKEEFMPGLDLTPEQLFFLGFAQLLCSDYKEEHYWEEITKEHTIDKYRVLGAVSNSEDFANAFNCHIGTKMNSKPEKCKLW